MTTGQNKRSILVVDDEDAVRSAICEALTREDYDVIGSPSAPDAIIKVSQMKFDVAILDILMPDMSGFELIRVMSKMCPDTPVIILTAVVDPGSQFGNVAEAAGVVAYLKKPCKLRDLKDALQTALDQQQVFL